MKQSNELEQLILTNKRLSANNVRLTKVNQQALDITKACLDSHEKLLKHCSHIYQYLDSKIDKTWEEKKSLDVLYNLLFSTTKK